MEEKVVDSIKLKRKSKAVRKVRFTGGCFSTVIYKLVHIQMRWLRVIDHEFLSSWIVIVWVCKPKSCLGKEHGCQTGNVLGKLSQTVDKLTGESRKYRVKKGFWKVFEKFHEKDKLGDF